jgi:hypothetical protein
MMAMGRDGAPGALLSSLRALSSAPAAQGSDVNGLRPLVAAVIAMSPSPYPDLLEELMSGCEALRDELEPESPSPASRVSPQGILFQTVYV